MKAFSRYNFWIYGCVSVSRTSMGLWARESTRRLESSFKWSSSSRSTTYNRCYMCVCWRIKTQLFSGFYVTHTLSTKRLCSIVTNIVYIILSTHVQSRMTAHVYVYWVTVCVWLSYCVYVCECMCVCVSELTRFSWRYISMREEWPPRPPSLEIWLPDKSIT